uniref:Mediator of RNA polymerase II transcription subunit 13 n=1 Tax=Timema monikensis TaxID=170555 RepID=A0A7R9EAG7_9NEOP|nr:unnamed protein product [Timema monikensis]
MYLSSFYPKFSCRLPPPTEAEWKQLLEDMLDLQSKVFSSVEVQVVYELNGSKQQAIVEVLGPLADHQGDHKKDGVMFANSLDKALKSRFSFYDSDPIFCPSMLCDPRFRGVLIDDMVAVNTLAIEVKKLSDKSSLEMNNPRAPLLYWASGCSLIVKYWASVCSLIVKYWASDCSLIVKYWASGCSLIVKYWASDCSLIVKYWASDCSLIVKYWASDCSLIVEYWASGCSLIVEYWASDCSLIVEYWASDCSLIVEYVLEGYNALSWLALDSNTRDRLSCLPVHIQALMQLYHMTSALV